MESILCVPVFDVKVQANHCCHLFMSCVTARTRQQGRTRPPVYSCCDALMEEHAMKGSCTPHLRRTDQLLGTPSAVRLEK